MTFVSLQQQIRDNRRKTWFLLSMFPTYIILLVWSLTVTFNYLGNTRHDGDETEHFVHWSEVNESMLSVLPWVLGIVGLWFVIAYFYNVEMVRRATGARPMAEGKQLTRLTRLMKQLTLSAGMPMPSLDIIDTPEMNAYACGINEKNYTIAVTTGLLSKLNDRQLSAVLGHELSHIRNHDTRLAIVSIIFVGILYYTSLLVFLFGIGLIVSDGDSKNSKDEDTIIMIIGLVFLVVIGGFVGVTYFFTLITHFSLSRKREYLADAGSVMLTSDSQSLAEALRIISGRPALGDIDREDIAQLFFYHKAMGSHPMFGWIEHLFDTHPDIEERIRLAESY